MLELNTVCECNRCLGGKTWHPQASLISLENPPANGQNIKFGFYAVILIKECPAHSGLGRKYYDYSNAAMTFLSPGEVFRLAPSETLPGKGFLLTFHPDLLNCVSARNLTEHYTFFGYRKEEALHLSERETGKIMCCLENMEDELHHPADSHTATLLARHIELLLDYCTRYYERQFITRENRNKELAGKAGRLMDDYIDAGKLSGGKPLSPSSIAEKLGLSDAYLTDLLKFETGRTPEELFQSRRIAAARRLLLCPEQTPASVSRCLGYPSVQQFSLLFKRLTGIAPGEYRHTQN